MEERFEELLDICLPELREPPSQQGAMPPPPRALPTCASLVELASLSRKGLIRDCEYTESLCAAVTQLVHRCWKDHLAAQTPFAKIAQKQPPPGQGGSAPRGRGLSRNMWGSGPPPVTVTGVAPWAKPVSQGGMPATVAPWATPGGKGGFTTNTSSVATAQRIGTTPAPASELSNDRLDRAVAAARS